MFKTNGGFTLVELIVVIAILAILASIAVPAYSGYIEKAEDVKESVEARTVEVAVNSACAFYDVNANNVTWEINNGTITVEAKGNALINSTTLGAISDLANEFYG